MMADRYIDADVARLLLREFDDRGVELIAACEAAIIRRVRAGEPLAAVTRDEVRAALRQILEAGRMVRLAIHQTGADAPSGEAT